MGRLGSSKGLAHIRPQVDSDSETAPGNLWTRKETYKKNSVGNSV